MFIFLLFPLAAALHSYCMCYSYSTSGFKLLLLCNDSGGDGKASSAFFVGGFVLGGIIVGALGCVYAPKVIAYLCSMLLSLVVAFRYVWNLQIFGGSIS